MPLFVFLQRQKVSVPKAAEAAVLCMKMPPGCDRFALRQCLRRGCSCSPVWGSPTPPTVDRWRKDVKCEPPPKSPWRGPRHWGRCTASHRGRCIGSRLQISIMKSTPSGEMHRKHHSIGAEVSQTNQDCHDRERQADLQSQDCHDRQRQISANQDRHNPQVDQPMLRRCGSHSKGPIEETKPDNSETKRTKYEGAICPSSYFCSARRFLCPKLLWLQSCA